MASRPEPDPIRTGIFSKTIWGEVTHGAKASAARRDHAQEEFYRTYWRPVFYLVCQHGFVSAEAEDLTEDFLLHFLQSGALSRAHPAKGRLRDFIAMSLNHYLIDGQRRAGAQKRGGKFVHVGLDDPEVGQLRTDAPPEEGEYVLWKDETLLSALRDALGKLETQYAQKGRASLFRVLKQLLLSDGETGYAGPAQKLHCSPATLRSDARRFRARLGKLLRAARKPARAAPAK